MARAIERIEQDITMLKEAIRAIATELHSNYVSYLNILGKSLQKQLILAAYHLCTQGYADKFLKLSLSQRQKLQQGIRKLGQKGAEQLLVYIQGEATQESEENQTHEEHEEHQEIEESQEIDESENNPFSFSTPPSTETTNREAASLKSKIPNPKYLDPSNPVDLAEWHQDLEAGIQETLKKISHDANVLFQKAGILPNKLPEPILAAAAAASEVSGEMIPGPPNLLNIVIEISSEQEAEEARLTQLTTINLRLGEIEFADTTLLSGRKQIRNTLLQLSKLGRDYQKKQRELKVAEAEAAWRASWFED
ncbi:hypothetical protein [Anabaena azotica]|uniref:hypothetical protein n=1 Tax=Anabaena azotica TaxID=197653 RepID=UPI0039A525EA